jgi:hypothetical protein
MYVLMSSTYCFCLSMALSPTRGFCSSFDSSLESRVNYLEISIAMHFLVCEWKPNSSVWMEQVFSSFISKHGSRE